MELNLDLYKATSGLAIPIILLSFYCNSINVDQSTLEEEINIMKEDISSLREDLSVVTIRTDMHDKSIVDLEKQRK